MHSKWSHGCLAALLMLPMLGLAQVSDSAKLDTNKGVAVDSHHLKYPYVQWEQNHFTGDFNSPTMHRFYQQFEQMLQCKTGRLNVVHFGGSHIQADIWSNYLREQLQGIDTNVRGARGILFPFKAAKTNRPYSYDVHYTGEWQGHRSPYNKHKGTWGVTGITATTKDTLATLKFDFRRSKTPVKTKTIDLLTNLEQNDYELDIDPDSGNFVHVFHQPNGYTRIEFLHPVDSFELAFRKPAGSSSELEFYGLVSDNQDPGIAYHSIGANGSRFHSFKRCELFDDQLTFLMPDLVIMSIGTNDSSEPEYDSTEYKTNFRAFLQQIRAVNPECAFILTVPNDNYVRRKYHNDNLRSVRHVIYELAEEFEARVWDLYGIMGAAGSAKTWMNEGMMKPDLVHFTTAGYLFKGKLFYEAWHEDYLRWHQQQPPVWND